MKQSLKNDKGLAATLPTNYPGEGNNNGIGKTGPTQENSEKLLKGQLVGFKNAETIGKNKMNTYDFEPEN